MPKTTVESALNATMAEIRTGAAPWTISASLLHQLKAHYRPDFQQNLTNWPKVKAKVLRIARFQGAIAALLSESEKPEQAKAGRVDAKVLWMASMVVQIGCPPDRWMAAQVHKGFRTFGKNCRKIPASRINLELLHRLGGQLREVAPPQRLAAIVSAFAGASSARPARVA